MDHDKYTELLDDVDSFVYKDFNRDLDVVSDLDAHLDKYFYYEQHTHIF